jgi:dynein heavy chain, axonemal
VDEPPEDGALVSGLWLEGARWDGAARCLAEPEPGAVQSPLPVLHVRPQPEGAPPEGCYECPLYKTSAR